MSFGGDADRGEAARLYAACREAGINFFDCADTYSAGAAEEILGALIGPERDEIVLTSKVAMPVGSAADINARGLNRRYIARGVENSLKRLGTDRLDVLFVHRWDDNTPLEETLRALEQLVRDGKVLYLGVSNYAAWQIAQALGIQERHGWARCDVIQPMYNLVKRQAEVEILPLAQANGMGVISYGPNGGGLLTGKYRRDQKPDGTRLVTNKEYAKRYDEVWYYEVAEAFTALADQRGVHPVSLATAWAAFHPTITCPIIGARTVDQLKPALASIDVEMDDDLWGEIAALSRTPAPATDRLEEQR
jgi:aryl-alcohol dehydrogenase-like predicted oxidoreductase